MQKKRTPYIISILVLAGLFVVVNLVSLIINIFNPESIYNQIIPLSTTGDFIFTILNIIIFSIYFFKLYYYKKNLIKWTGFGFLFLGFQVLLMRVFYIIETKASLDIYPMVSKGIASGTSSVSYIISLHILIGVVMILAIFTVWKSFRKHLKLKKIKN